MLLHIIILRQHAGHASVPADIAEIMEAGGRQQFSICPEAVAPVFPVNMHAHASGIQNRLMLRYCHNCIAGRLLFLKSGLSRPVTLIMPGTNRNHLRRNREKFYCNGRSI